MTLEYTHPADNLAAAVTPVLSGATVITGYGVANLSDGDPMNPFKCNATTMRLVWNFGAPVTIKAVILVHHNLGPAGLAGVKWQMHTADSWATPDFSSTLTVPAYHEDKFPANILGDFRPTNPSKQYASLAITTANAVAVAIGEILILAEIRALTRNLLLSKTPEEEEDHPHIENVTDGGATTIYSHGTRQRWLRGVVIEQPATTEIVRQWNRATRGRFLSFALLPHMVGEEPWQVRFEKSPLKRTYWGAAFTSVYPLAFQEVGRGLIPQPSAV